ncbi:arginase family protein [Ferruginibacter lapsinanis]|uniref:arginase family protein n=1 Tax=Ferruginibacter lapsinanis TaxID=563172 RepID=UPI001E6541E2|nr:arginase family protein [Ferruginibacter lapsinanis]UEG48791.1 arginase family protein [Ferruginibacter lapsinanis]
MTDLSLFDPNAVSNPNNNIFGLPFTKEDAKLIILPVPWEVTVSRHEGTARAPEHIFRSSLLVELFDPTLKDKWRKGYYMPSPDKKILLKSDYLRKEAELYINYITDGGVLLENKFMCKTIKEINAGSLMLNNWVYENTNDLFAQDKLVGILGGDLSTSLGYYKALAGKHGGFGILQIDAHCSMRKAYEGFMYSHASAMYNALEEISDINKIVQVGIRDFCEAEWDYIANSNGRVTTYLDVSIKNRIAEGESWKSIVDEIVSFLPDKVVLSYDIDGLDPKLCPNTSTPVYGGFEAAQIFYLCNSVLKSGRKIIGFNLNEIGISTNEWDEKVGARVLFDLCNLLMTSNE